VPFDSAFRDKLCELEPTNPLLRERYVKELQAMFEAKLSLPLKVFVGVVTVASIAIALFLGGSAVTHGELPVAARAGLFAGAVFALAWAGLTAWSLRRGSMLLRIQPPAMAALLWVFAVLMDTCFLVLAPGFPDHFHALVMLFVGLATLIGAGVFMIGINIQQATLRTQESLLRLEYLLAEIAESEVKKP
jgi:hypothetical protein